MNLSQYSPTTATRVVRASLFCATLQTTTRLAPFFAEKRDALSVAASVFATPSATWSANVSSKPVPVPASRRAPTTSASGACAFIAALTPASNAPVVEEKSRGVSLVACIAVTSE
ncbi:hypothetical protein BC830DRAFT_599198 [Chytriomyces sp. MP71]|nr:hypothetical protein BC830DRAFT_599198 [Chytriomyces sp. MP71]